MKKSSDPRHLKRVARIQKLFAWEFAHGKDSPQEMDFEEIAEIVKNLPKIDDHIKEAAPMWPIEKINRIDLAVLRNAAFELLVDQKNPPKVIVDESIEIAKELGADSSPAFVNGALGKLIENSKIST